MKLIFAVFVFACISASGQDAATMASQQAAQAAETANQQAMIAAQQANQQAMRDSQQASDQAMRNMQNASPGWEPGYAYTQPPTFTVDSGKVARGTVVRIKSRTRRSAIYYTTDGWSPTTSSTRYTGPITIDKSTKLQAIAVAPNLQPSIVVIAEYTVPGSSPNVPPRPITTTGVLHAGTQLQLVTASHVTSKTAQVGDKLKLELAQDVKIGDEVVIPKGTPVDASITIADSAGHVGTPGDLAFEVHSLALDGVKIPLVEANRLRAPITITGHWESPSCRSSALPDWRCGVMRHRLILAWP